MTSLNFYARPRFVVTLALLCCLLWGSSYPAIKSLLAYLAGLSAVAISLWSVLLKHNRVSFVTAFNFMVPVFGALLSAVFLDERILAWKNAAALLLVCGGIWLVTVDPARR